MTRRLRGWRRRWSGRRRRLRAAIDVLPGAERRQLLVEWNATAADYPRDKCMHELFEAQAAKTPEAVAVVHEDRSSSPMRS